jgi:hypothetical protein
MIVFHISSFVMVSGSELAVKHIPEKSSQAFVKLKVRIRHRISFPAAALRLHRRYTHG